MSIKYYTAHYLPTGGPQVIPIGQAVETDEGRVPVTFGAPINLQAVLVSTTQVDLSWNAVNSATGYDIERDGTVIVFSHASTNYSDTGLTADTTYTYRVRSVR